MHTASVWCGLSKMILHIYIYVKAVVLIHCFRSMPHVICQTLTMHDSYSNAMQYHCWQYLVKRHSAIAQNHLRH